MRYPFEVNLVGDARGRWVNSSDGRRNEDRGWRDVAAKVAAGGRSCAAVRCQGGPDQSRSLSSAELSALLPEDAIIPSTPGPGELVRPAHPVRGSDARLTVRDAGHDGLGVPYVDRCEVRPAGPAGHALVGDGAMQMNGMDELITIAQVLAEWADPRLVVMVLQNDDLNQVTWELRAMGGSPQFLSVPGSSQTVDLRGSRRAWVWARLTVDEPEPGATSVGGGARGTNVPSCWCSRARPCGAADPTAGHLGRDRQREPSPSCTATPTGSTSSLKG